MILFLLFCFVSAACCYVVPPAKLEALYPKGLRVSVPGKVIQISRYI